MSLSPDEAPVLQNSFAGVGTHPTSASGCPFMLGVWITDAGIWWEGRPDLLCPRSCHGGCCWLGDAAQIHEVISLVFVSSYCISHPFLVKHKWLKEEGKCEEWRCEALNPSFLKKYNYNYNNENKNKSYHHLPQGCPNTRSFLTWNLSQEYWQFLFFQPMQKNYFTKCGKNQDTAEPKFLILSWRERRNIKTVKSDSCGREIRLPGVSFWLQNEPSFMTGRGYDAHGDHNKINFQPAHGAANLVMIWICGR